MRAIHAEDVWKSYPRWRPGTRSLRSVLSPGLRAARRSRDTRWALREVSFSVERGRGVGVIGHNGAGKSTLLRLVSGLGRPTRGSLLIAPNAASVLSLGDTFSMELTGRENATTAAVVCGLRLSEARAALPAILEFAELDGFEEAPVRSYSDGMKLRLAFGVVAQLTPDLLILDEVMAVGDLRFQKKCMDHVSNLRDRGTSVLLASHELGQVAEACDQVLWLDRGRARAFGDADQVIESYQLAAQSETLNVTPPPTAAGDSQSGLILLENRFGSQEMQIEDVVISSEAGIAEVEPGGTLNIAMTVRSRGPREPVIVSVAIFRPDGEVGVLNLNTAMDKVDIGPVGSVGVRLALSLDELELAPGRYLVDVGVYPTDWAHAYDYHWHVYSLTVRGTSEAEAVFRPRRRRWAVTSS
jgi:lipopolysaccharide transport system ATP-binding protein